MNKAVVIHIERDVEANKFSKCQLQGSLPAILEGIAVLIQQTARNAEVPEGHLVAVLATVLLTPGSVEQRTVEDGGSCDVRKEGSSGNENERADA